MKEKKWFWIILAYSLPVLLDQLCKLALQGVSHAPALFGPIGFFYSYADLNSSQASAVESQIIHSIVACVLAIFMAVCFVLIHFIFTHKHIWLRLSFSFLFGGFYSLIIDHILFAKTINNISLNSAHTIFPFNLAILFILIGACVFAYCLILDHKMVFQQKYLRRQFLLKNKNQNQFLIITLSCFTCIYLIFAGLMGVYFKISLSEISTNSALTAELSRNLYFLIFIIYLLSATLTFIVSLFLSHRIYGPVYGFQSYMRVLFEGKASYAFKTRDKDHFKELEKTAEYVRSRLTRKL